MSLQPFRGVENYRSNKAPSWKQYFASWNYS